MSESPFTSPSSFSKELSPKHEFTLPPLPPPAPRPKRQRTHQLSVVISFYKKNMASSVNEYKPIFAAFPKFDEALSINFTSLGFLEGFGKTPNFLRYLLQVEYVGEQIDEASFINFFSNETYSSTFSIKPELNEKYQDALATWKLKQKLRKSTH